MDSDQQSKKGPTNGVEIYAKKFKIDGVVSSDTYAKIVTDDYSGKGTVSVKSTPESTPGNIKGVFFEVDGDMLQDGVIKTDKNAVVGVNVRGDYTSNKGKIIQGEDLPNLGWHTTWWGISIVTLGCGLVVAFLVFMFGWNK